MGISETLTRKKTELISESYRKKGNHYSKSKGLKKSVEAYSQGIQVLESYLSKHTFDRQLAAKLLGFYIGMALNSFKLGKVEESDLNYIKAIKLENRLIKMKAIKSDNLPSHIAWMLENHEDRNYPDYITKALEEQILDQEIPFYFEEINDKTLWISFILFYLLDRELIRKPEGDEYYQNALQLIDQDFIEQFSTFESKGEFLITWGVALSFNEEFDRILVLLGEDYSLAKDTKVFKHFDEETIKELLKQISVDVDGNMLKD